MIKVEQLAERTFRSEEVERELIAYILRRKPTIVSRIKPEWFSISIHQNIIKIEHNIKALISRNALLSELKSQNLIGKKELQIYQDTLDDIYSVRVNQMNEKSAQICLSHIIEMYEGRSILYGIRDIANSVKSSTVLDMKNKLKRLGSGVKLPDEVLSGDYIAGYAERLAIIERKQHLREEGKDVGVATGVRVFDHMVGGLMRSEFGVIAGQPGVGKTAMLVSFAVHAWRQGYNVLFVTGEMPKPDIEFRMDSDIANIPATKFRFGNLSDKELGRWKRAINREQDLHENFLEVVSFPRDFTAVDIEGHALQIQEQYENEINLICLDYINIMNAVGSRHSAKDWQAQADTVWDVKSMCAALNGGICLWTAGQVKDEAFDSDILSLEDLKYARAISETAPVVIGLVRNQDDEAEYVLELQVLKMRNAPLPDQSIILKPNLEYMRIHEEVLPKNKDLLFMGAETRRKPPKKKRQYQKK